jgi:hypothetical protein
MIIETKFDVGQEVWAIILQYQKKTCPSCGKEKDGPEETEIVPIKIEDISVNFIGQGGEPCYFSHRPGSSFDSVFVNESNCFSDEAAALAEIERRKAQ